MPNVASLLKAEIERISKKTIRQHVGPLQSAVRSHRRQLSALKKEVAALQREVARLKRSGAATSPKLNVNESETTVRFVAKGFKSLRERLGLTAEEIGRLLGVSAQSVYNWEHEKARPRAAQVQAIAALRGLGKREVKARLEAAVQ